MAKGFSKQVKEAIKLLPKEYRAAAAKALKRAGDNARQLAQAILAVGPDQREGMGFLIAYMPECDLVSLPRYLLVENAMVRAHDLSRVNLAFFTVNGVISVLLGALATADCLLGLGLPGHV